jgi:hypothetical protein
MHRQTMPVCKTQARLLATSSAPCSLSQPLALWAFWPTGGRGLLSASHADQVLSAHMLQYIFLLTPSVWRWTCCCRDCCWCSSLIWRSIAHAGSTKSGEPCRVLGFMTMKQSRTRRPRCNEHCRLQRGTSATLARLAMCGDGCPVRTTTMAICIPPDHSLYTRHIRFPICTKLVATLTATAGPGLGL